MEEDSKLLISTSCCHLRDDTSVQRNSLSFLPDSMPQNFIVVCFDSNFNQSNDNQTSLITEVQRIADSVNAFSDADECVNFLKEIKNEKVFMIISNTLDLCVAPLIEKFAQVDAIYILCSDITKYERWVNEMKKVKGVFADIRNICDLLKCDVQAYDRSLIPISIISENDSAKISMSEHSQSFLDIQSNIPMRHVVDNQIMHTISFNTSFARMLENIVVICLDLNSNPLEAAERNWFIEVQEKVNMLNKFTDADECVDFLTEIENENVLMIVSGSDSMHVVSHVEEFHQLKSIYVLSSDKALHEVWTKKSTKVKGVFTKIQDILPSLTCAIQQYDRASVPISIIQANDSASISLNELDQSFMYTQLIKEILLEIKYDSESKQQFIDFCRCQYSNNDLMLQAIDRFDREYDIHSPIWWYSKEIFIYSILNRALRTQEIGIIMKMGFFMQDLHRQIEYLYRQRSDKPNLLTVYRGQDMLNSDFERLRKGKGSLISFNNFLSTSTDREVSFCFADSVQSDPRLVGVFFEIKINSEFSSTPFVALDEIGHHKDEKEILFSMHSIFKIGEAHQIDDRLWQVELLSTTGNDQEMSKLTDYTRKSLTGKINPWERLGELLLQMGDLTEAEKIFKTLVDRYSTFVKNQQGHLNALYALGLIRYLQSDFSHALLFFEKALQLNLPDCHGSAMIHTGIALVQSSMGNYTTALSIHKKALEILQKSTDNDHVILAMSYTYIGDIYTILGRPWDAISYLKKGIEIYEKSLPSNHPSLATFYNYMGEAYRLAGDYSHASFYHKKALNIQEKYLPANHLELAHTLNGLGIVHDTMGNYLSALSYLLKTLYIRKNSLIPDHPELAKTYTNIGAVFKSMKHYLKALSCYQKALDIYEKFSDLNLPELATTYHNIADVFNEMGNYSTALAFYLKTLKIEQKSLSHDHPTVGTTYYSMAITYDHLGDYSTALSFLEKARAIQEKGLHFNHPDLIATYNQFAIVHLNMRDYSTALSFLEKNREIQEKDLPSNHPDLAATYNQFAIVYQGMGDYLTARSLLEKVREIQERYLHPNHPNLATIYNNLAAVHHKMKDYSTALWFFEKARLIQEKHFHSNHPNLALIYQNIGVLYTTMGDNLTALSFFQKARQIQEKNFPPDHPVRVQTL